MSRAQDIVGYWMRLSSHEQFSTNPKFDKELQTLYGDDVSKALNGSYDAWLEDEIGTLALILLLDQMNRNINRGTAMAYEADAKARDVADLAIDRKYDRKLKPAERAWCYMPFMHSESLADQERSVALFKDLASNLKFAIEHRDIIQQFGRFPHRNLILGRKSTPEEDAFLKAGGFSV